MAIIRNVPRLKRGPSFRGRIMIDTIRGVLRVRKWPKKRGRPRSALQRAWVDWFVQANRLAKYADGMSMARAIEMTKGSGLYPRDVLLMAMRGRLYSWVDQDGWKWYSMAAIGDISESLDVLAQTVGSVMVRAVDRWRAPAAGIINDVLTYKGALTPPVWQAPGGGVSQNLVPGTPITPDGTKAQYILDVTSFAQIEFSEHLVGFAAADRTSFRLSTDGGLTYHAAATDYNRTSLDSAGSLSGDLNQIHTSIALATTGHNTICSFANLRIGRLNYNLLAGLTAGLSILRYGFANFDGPVTHIKVFSFSGANYNAGTIRAVGIS